MSKYQLLLFCLFCTCSFLSAHEEAQTKKIEESEMEIPPYLYKILSYSNWQATESRRAVNLSAEDASFIHFSTEEQLDRIVSKYWADVPQYVILKIRIDKLEGELKYEANPGGSTKYYHLYNGHIPFEAIVESKVIYRETIDDSKQTLDIVEIGNPVLRQTARLLSKEEILSDEIQNLIEEMKTTMHAAPGVGLAAPQIGRSLQLIVIEDTDHSRLTQEQLKERERFFVPFHVVINPKLYIEDADNAEFFEGCLSVPGLIGIVPRAKAVRVECLNERGEPVTIHAKGWYARILQHEIDHVNGTLLIDHALLKTLTTDENYYKLWKTVPIQEIKNKLS